MARRVAPDVARHARLAHNGTRVVSVALARVSSPDIPADAPDDLWTVFRAGRAEDERGVHEAKKGQYGQ